VCGRLSLKAELVEKATAPKILLVEFFPAKEPFMVLHFKGTGCLITEAAVEGSIAAEVTTDTTGVKKRLN
jgi:hypothetical protein